MAVMAESKVPELFPETGSKPPSSTPAYFVIVHQSQGDDKKEERIFVANRDVSAVAKVIHSGPPDSKSVFLSADCTSGKITVTLDNNNMWNEFYHCSTEMVLTKQGRRMFPYCRYWLSGLSPCKKYILVMDIAPLDTHRYKWNGKFWEPGGKSEPHVLGRVFIHPESPSTGEYWMNQPVSFYKLKLTNNVLDQEGHIILHSMHRYLPRLHVIPADKTTEVIQLNGPDVHTFTFPQTEFFAVTAYQNVQITQLKIDCNPFAKGFREGTVVGRLAKDAIPKKILQANDAANNNHAESTEKLKEPFMMSEHSDADTENESFSAEKEAQNFSPQIAVPEKGVQQETDTHGSLADASPAPLLTKIKEEPTVVNIKEEPEDNYDYDQAFSSMAVHVKQEDPNDDVTDEYSNNDDDFPILERHFARFSTRLNSGRRSRSGVAKAKLLKLEDNEMPKLYLESCFSQKQADNTSNLLEPTLTAKMAPNFDLPANMPRIKEEPIIKTEKRRPVKNKVYAEYFTPPTFGTNRGRKRKLPSLSKSRVAETPGSESTVEPVVKKRRGRPPKHKGAKVGRPPKKRLAIEAPQMLPDFKPDLEDVDGVLFVAFSSKEALDVHTGGKSETAVPPTIPPAIPPASPAQPPAIQMTEEHRKILELEKQLLAQLRTMRHRQVIHPSLQQVGLKLNIVDHSMAIDLWYLGVELPLPFFTNDSRLENSEFSTEASVFSFVSRTGKTTDYTKIKGWRDKFSANSVVKSEGLEAPLKNRSAFCSDELDEYLENEAKLMEDIKGTFQIEPVSATVSCQFPTKSSSYVRTLDSVLKKQASQLSSSNSLNVLKPPTIPVKKRKYTRRRGGEYKDAELDTRQKGVNSKTLPIAPAAAPAKWQLPENNTGYARALDSGPNQNQASEVSPNSVTLSNSEPVKKRKYTRRSLTPKMKMKLKAVLSPPVIKEDPDKPRSPQKQKSPKKSKPIPAVTSPVPSQPGEKSPVAAQSAEAPSVLPAIVCPRTTPAPLQSTPPSQKTMGLSKAQLKLLELEKNALWEGKPRTYITEERAEVALSALLTAQVSLKSKPVFKMINKRTTSCENEFCRLGCVCASLSRAKPNPAHCQQETCMFGCQCEKGQVYGRKDMPSARIGGKSEITSTSVLEEDLGCTTSVDESQEETERARASPEQSNNTSSAPEPASESDTKGITTEKHDCNQAMRSPKIFPIWDRSDVDNDPEPICIPEQSPVGYRTPHRRGTSERGKSSANKYEAAPTPRPAVGPEDLDSEYLGDEMSCARIRIYKPKAPEKKPKQDHNLCTDPEPPGKDHVHKLDKHTEQEKENAGDVGKEVVEKRHKNGVPAKLLKIISDCNWEQERRKILNIVSQRIDNKEPQSFRVDRFIIELTSETMDGDTAKYSAVSRMKISVAPDQQKDQPLVKSPPVKVVKPPGQLPLEKSPEKDAKSQGGKGLPFYTKVLPAGKLIARLKNSTLKQSELIQVNGINFPQAKLLLGHMGALHPANRLAAYLTHKLQPNLPNPSHDSNAKASSSNTTIKASAAVSSPEHRTVAPSEPKSVMEDPENSQQNSPGNQSLTLSSAGLPKPHTQPPLSPVSSSNQVQVVSSASPVSTVTSLTVPGKMVPAASSVNTTKMATFSPTKDTVPTPTIPPPALIRAPCPAAASSSAMAACNPGTNKTLAASVASSLVASANLPTIGMVGSPPRTPTVTVKTVTSPFGSSPRPGLTPETNKRLGPRLLLIPVPSSSATLRPIQCVQTSPGQRMVLQPIKSPNGINLFRHPNGQLIQLVPLHHVQAKSLQPSQRVVIRSPGPAIHIQLPLQTKPDIASAASNATTTPVVSPKTSLNKSPVILSGPSAPCQISAKAGPVQSPSTSTSSGPAVITPPALSLHSDKMPANVSSKSCCEDAVSIPDVMAVTAKPGIVIEANQAPGTTLLAPGSEEKINPIVPEMLESDNTVNLVQSMLTESEDQGANSPPSGPVNGKEEHGAVLANQVMLPSHLKESDSEKANVTVGAVIPDVGDGGTSGSSQKGSRSADGGVGSLLRSQTGTIAGKSGENTDSPPVRMTRSRSLYAARSLLASHSECGTNKIKSSEDSDAEHQLRKPKETDGGQTAEPTPKEEQDPVLVGDAEPCRHIKESEHSSQTEDSDVDESVDVETVEELSEVSIARLKSFASPDASNKEGTAGKVCKKDAKVSGDQELDSYRRNRHTHTAKERERRNEMRDLFEELKNALGLHNLPKVSKSYILKKAIEEIEGLTDEADNLTRQKTLMTQMRNQLIRKMSKLSAQPKEAVLKKVEYLYAKQKILEAEIKKNDSNDKEMTNQSPLCGPLRLEDEAVASSCSNSNTPALRSRKAAMLVEMSPPRQSAVITAPNVLLASAGPGTKLRAAGSGPLLVPADMEPSHVQTEKEDLSMMPRIVNVTSLADEASLGSVTMKGIGTEAHSDLMKEISASVLVSGHTERELPSGSSEQSTCSESVHKVTNEGLDFSPLEDFTLADISGINAVTSSMTSSSVNPLSFEKISQDGTDCGLEMELKTLSSAIEELEPGELSEVTGDQEDADETLTSLLNEIELLNQHLNSDHVDLDSDFHGSDGASQGHVSASADSGSSPFFFGRFRELSESKENLLLSPLFLQLREGEIQESVKNAGEPSILVYDDGANKEKPRELQRSPDNLAPLQTGDRPVAPAASDALWRPMPKLAPLGLKSPTLVGDQRGILNKSMPSLASAAVRQNSPKPME